MCCKRAGITWNRFNKIAKNHGRRTAEWSDAAWNSSWWNWKQWRPGWPHIKVRVFDKLICFLIDLITLKYVSAHLQNIMKHVCSKGKVGDSCVSHLSMLLRAELWRIQLKRDWFKDFAIWPSDS
jgi:hypothetical protein